MKRVIFLLAMMSSLFIFSGLCYAATIFVSPSGGANAPCTDSANPCDLQTGLNAAALTTSDDVIQMQTGTYNGPFIYFGYTGGALTILGNGAIIDGGRHLDAQSNIVGKAGLLVFTNNPNADDSAFTITIRGATFQNGVTVPNLDGAGLSIRTNSADVNILHCRFTNNVNTLVNARGGGGLFFESRDSGSINLIDNSFSDNLSLNSGGAAYLDTVLGSISLVGNNFTGNLSTAIGGITGGQGGAVQAIVEGTGDLTVNRNFFHDNLGGLGGGMYGQNLLGNIFVTNNIFSANEAVNSSSAPNQGGAGAGFLVVLGSIELINNTFAANKSTNGDGGGLTIALGIDSDTLDFYNNIIINNLATGSTCAGTCNDIFINDDGDKNNIGSPVNVFNNDYSDISFTCGAGCKAAQNVDPTTNIDKDPMFVNAATSDFRLLTGSPAIDAGTAAAPFLPEKDFALNARNQGSAPDMGALESKPGENPQPGSENCSNNVDDDGNGLIDCNDPACSADAVCTGGEGGGGGGVTPNAGNGGGCSMTATSGSSSSIFYLVVLLLFVAGALIRNLKSGRSE